MRKLGRVYLYAMGGMVAGALGGAGLAAILAATAKGGTR